MKKLGLMMMAASMGIFTAGCGAESGQGGNGGSAEDQVTVDLWQLPDNKAHFEKIIEDFEKENPDINVEMSTKAVDAHKEGLKVAASSDTMPTMWFNWGGTLASFYTENDMTLDLTSYAEENGWNEKFEESALNLVTIDEQLAGVPTSLNGLGIFYRKDIFEKLGLEEPTTFEEFEKVMADLKAGGVTPISVGGKFGWHTMRFTEAILEHYAGPELKDNLISLEESWDNDAVRETYAKLKDWEKKGYFPEGFITIDPTEAKMPFYSGDAAMVLEGPWFDGIMIADQFDASNVGFFPMPTGQEPNRISSFAEMLQISSSATEEQQDAAVKFAEYVMSEEVITKYKEETKFPVPVKGIEAPEELPHAEEIIEALGKGNFLITDQALPQEVVTKFFEAQDKIITGELKTDDAVEMISTFIEDYKAQQ